MDVTALRELVARPGGVAELLERLQGLEGEERAEFARQLEAQGVPAELVLGAVASMTVDEAERLARQTLDMYG